MITQKRVALFIFLVILLSAYCFRYDQGPMQTEEKIKYYYARDRWSGESFKKVYGEYQGKIYAGDMIAIIDPMTLKYKTTKFMETSTYAEQEDGLSFKINELNKRLGEYAKTHPKYMLERNLILKEYVALENKGWSKKFS